MISVATYTLLLISLTFNIFILCYIGELLMEKVSCVPRLFHLRACNLLNGILQTTAVGLSCFTIDWYHLPTKTIQGLILVIGVSNNPCKISAGGIVDLNLSTFGNVSIPIRKKCMLSIKIADKIQITCRVAIWYIICEQQSPVALRSRIWLIFRFIYSYIGFKANFSKFSHLFSLNIGRS